MLRAIVDTNVFIGSAWNAASASRRVVEACRSGEITLVVSSAIRREYDRIIPRAVRSRVELGRIDDALSRAQLVEPKDQSRVVPGDPDDDKFIAAALTGRAEALITNDEHLLVLGEHKGVRILRPGDVLEIDRGPGESTDQEG
jgi:putative PIN family toxin of toxin-antitoxin system